MDSVISRGIAVIREFGSLPEIQACFKAWEFFEELHSYSYSFIIQSIFADPDEVFSDTLKDPEIMARAASVVKEFDALKNFSSGDLRKQLILALISAQIMEGVRFYVSFACSFSFAEPPNARMEGNAKIVKEICRDENIHVDITRTLFNILRTDPKEEFVDTIRECKDIIEHMFVTACNEEKAWADYLFSMGPVFGINAEVMHGYTEWTTDQRMIGLGYKPIYKRDNPIGGWLSNWLEGHKVQPAPQETEIESYKTGSVVSNLASTSFADEDLG